MPCSRTEHLLREYFSDGLNHVMRAEIEDHVTACPDCAGQLREMLGTANELRRWDDIPAPRWGRHMAMFRRERNAGRSNWRLAWQWIPAVASALMLGLMLLNASVIYQAGSVQISFGAPAMPAVERSQGNNPFAMPALSARVQPETPTQLTAEDERHPRFDLLLRASEIDFSTTVNSAISQAGEYARMLRDAGGVDAETFERLRIDIEALRQENQAGIDRLGEWMEELRSGAAARGERFEEALAEFSEEMEQLKARAQTLADELRERSDRTQLDR